MATKESWGARVTLCCAALVGCGGSSDGTQGDEGDDGEQKINIVVKTLTADACLPRPLVAGDDGRTESMTIVEATTAACDCARPGRDASPSSEVGAVREMLNASGLCGESTGVSCSDYCGCRILELAGPSSDPASPLYACQNQTTVSDASLVGYCYVAPGRLDENGMPAPLGNPELVSACPATEQQRIRFIGADTPLPGADLFVAAYGTSVPIP